ncbi:MAG TPA: hypothetical protein PKE45_20160 [Caldilineaceae bacterium]|nr:hypothetical protein [Caldilineaceae bacterium]
MTQWTAQWGTGQLPQDDDGITARPIQPGDAGLIDEMHRRLSPESLYFRYLQPRIPPLAEIEQVCTLPSEKGAGFVATVHEEKEKVFSVAY